MKTIDITFKDFFEFLDFDESVEEERVKCLVDIDGDGSYFAVKPNGSYTQIEHIIKKPRQKYVSVKIMLPSGDIIYKEVSPKHIFISSGQNPLQNLFAEDSEGLVIDTIYGDATVLEVKEIGEDELYDISIESPNLYIDNFGIVHHNSFVGLKLAKNAQKKNKDWIVIYIDTEMAFDFKFAKNIGIDLNRLMVIQGNQIEDVQKQIMSISNEFTKEERKNILMVIDSWGGLVTSKTVNDATSGNDAADFTAAKKKNTLSKLLTGLGMTVFVVNQVYDCGTYFMEVETENGVSFLGDIKIGERVLTSEGYQEVSNIFKYTDSPVYSIKMENGEILEFTEGHKFLVERGGVISWKQVGELEPNDDIQIYDSKIPM